MAEKEKQWRLVRLTKEGLAYRGRVLPDRWVEFQQDKSDGYANWRKGQKVNWPYPTEKLMFYLEAGVCVPCDPPGPKRKPKDKPDGYGLYRILESFATAGGGYARDQQVVLQKAVGDKYAERGMAVWIKEVQRDSDEWKQLPHGQGVRAKTE